MARSEFSFFFPFRVRYAEVDGQMIVFNAHYLTYFDTAITEFFRVLPYDYQGQVERTGEDYHTVKTLVEYYAPIRFDDEIEVGVRSARIGRSSLTFGLEIHAKGRDERPRLGRGGVGQHRSGDAPPGAAPGRAGGEAAGLRRRRGSHAGLTGRARAPPARLPTTCVRARAQACDAGGT